MTVIMFIEQCEVLITGDYDAIDQEYAVWHTFMSGEEVEVESISAVDAEDEDARIVFSDGTEALVQSSYFVRVL